MPQNPQGRKLILKADGSVVDEFGNVVRAGTTQEGPLSRPPATPQSDYERKSFDGGSWALAPAESMTGRDLAVGGIKALATGASFIPGMGQLATAARIAVPALLEGGAEALDGGDPMGRMTGEAMLGAVGEAGGRVLPKAFNRAALASGGLFRGENKLAKRAAQAFTDINERRPWWNPLLVGQTERATALKKRAGNALEVAEEATPGIVPLTDLGNANKAFSDAARNTAEPITLKAAIGHFDRTFIEQQAMERNGIDPAVWRKLAPAQKAYIINTTPLNARDLGELKRGLGASTNPVTAARREGVYVPASDRQQATMSSNLAERTKEAQEALDTSGEIAKANKNFGDAATVVGAHQKMRSTSMLSDPSVVGARAAIGATIAGLMGMPMAAGLPLGMTLLNPKSLSAEGHLLGYATKAAPGSWRATDAITSQSEDQRKIRRRRLNEKDDKK